MRKIISLLTFSLLFQFSTGQSTEGMFIELHVLASSNLEKSAKEFETKLLESSSNDTILKYIDRYSFAIEEVIPLYEGNQQMEDTQLKQPFNDVKKMLTEILRNNYNLLGQIIYDELSEDEIKSASKQLIDENKLISQFIGIATLSIFGATVKDRPEGANDEHQFSKLTQKDSDRIKQLIAQLFGEDVIQSDAENLETGYAMSANILYKAFSLDWEYEEK